jgi:hypothetical protein
MKTPANIPAPETTATDYISQELTRSRKALKRTRAVGAILVCGIAAYIGTITYILTGYFEPVEAAQVASGMLTQRVAADGPAFAASAEAQILSLLHQTPDYLKQQLPVLRKELQAQFEHEFQTYCASLSADLGNKMDLFIEDHQAEIKSLLDNAHDRAAIRKTLPSFDQMVADFVQNDVDGLSLKKHIDDLGLALKEVEKRMDRLANATDLTVEEQKARRALAVIAKATTQQTSIPSDGKTVTLGVASVK